MPINGEISDLRVARTFQTRLSPRSVNDSKSCPHRIGSVLIGADASGAFRSRQEPHSERHKMTATAPRYGHSRNPIRILTAIALTIELCLLLVHHYFQFDRMHLYSLNSLFTICLVTSVAHIAIIFIFSDFNITSMPMMYFIVMSLYMLSTPLLYIIVGDSAFSFWRYVDPYYIRVMMPSVSIAFAASALGVVVASLKGRSKHEGSQVRKVTSVKVDITAEYLALIFLAISVLLVAGLTLAGSGLFSLLEGGYAAYSDMRRSGEQNLFFNLVMTRILPISALTYVGMRKYRFRDFGFADLVFFSAMLIPLLAGDRGTLLSCCAAWAFLHSSLCKRLRSWHVVLGASLAFLIVPTLQVLRSTGGFLFDVDSAAGVVMDLSNSSTKFQGEFWLAILGPFSPALMTFAGAIKQIDTGMDYRLGLDYIQNAAAAIPFNSRMAANNSQQIHEFLIPGRQGGPGYMAISEMYVNFGAPGIAVGHFGLGYFLSRLQKSYDARISHTGGLGVSFSAIILFTFIIWIRNESSYVAQVLFYWILIFSFLSRFVARTISWKN